MTLLRKSVTLIALTGLVVLAGCSYQQMVKLAEQQEVKVQPNPLELHGDSVSFDISAVLPVNMLRKNRVYTLKTTYKYGPEENRESFTFKDYDFPQEVVEQPSMSKQYSMKYVPEMASGNLYLQGVVSNLEKTKFKKTPELDIAKGVLTTSRLVQTAVGAAYADHGYNNKEELIPINVEFFFDKGSARLNRSEVSGANGQKLDAFIASKNKTRTVTITGSHSPEGLESINSELSEDRATVIKDFYFKKMKEYDYKNMADSIKFETNVVFQKWDPFLTALNKNETLSADEKAQVRSIVNAGGGSFEATEKEIAKLPFYKSLEKEVYPGLRVSKTTIMSVKEKLTDAEISILAKAIYEGNAKADTLKFEELMYAATLTPLPEEKVKIYEAASKHHGDWKAHNNAGAIYLEMALETKDKTKKADLLEKASAQIDLSINKQETAIALNNKGAIMLLRGNKDEAYKAYKQAQNAGNMTSDAQKAIGAGKGSIEIMKGNYESAIVSLETAGSDFQNVTFNIGLAQLLMKDYENAKKKLKDAILEDGKNAIYFYVSAVNGARMKDDELVQADLAEAVKIDSALKEKALKDLEFGEYWTKPAFTEAVK